MRNCSPILAAVLAAGTLLGTVLLTQGGAIPVGSCVVVENGHCLLLMNSTPVAVLKDERKQNPWIRQGTGKELMVVQNKNTLCHTEHG